MNCRKKQLFVNYEKLLGMKNNLLQNVLHSRTTVNTNENFPVSTRFRFLVLTNLI